VSKPAAPNNAAHTIENLFMFPPQIIVVDFEPADFACRHLQI